MSVVTNVILTCSVDEDEAIQTLADKISALSWGRGRQLRNIADSDWIAGTKALEASVLIGSFNFFDQDDFLTALRTTKFKYPQQVQVFIKEQESTEFGEISILLPPKQRTN